MINDTDPQAQAVLDNLLRNASIARKLEIMSQLNQVTRTLAISNIREQYPDANETFVRYKLAERLLGKELVCKVLGELPVYA